MRNKSGTSILILLILIISASLSIHHTYSNNVHKAPPGYVDHEPIFIDSDQDFIDLGLPGDGSSNNPYLIENFYFLTDIDHYCILIASTSKYFVIQNCYFTYAYGHIYLIDIAKDTAKIQNNIFDGTMFNSYYSSISIYYSSGVIIEGNDFKEISYDCITIQYSSHLEIRDNDFDCRDDSIYIENSKHCLVEFNTFLDGDVAVYISESENCIISENSFSELRRGVVVYISYYILIQDNLIENCSSTGLHINYSFFINITNNVIKNCSYGLSFSLGVEIEINYNVIESLSYGIVFDSTVYNCTVISNTLIGGGFYFRYLSAEMINTFTIIDNLINGKELGLFVNVQKELFLSEDYAQLIFFNCSYITIRGLQLFEYSTPLYTYECSNVHIERNLFRDCGICYIDYRSEFIFFEDNRIYDSYLGIMLYGSTNSTVASNTLNGNEIGLRAEYVFDSTINHNSFEDNIWGIYIDGIYRTQISQNRCIKNNNVDSPDNFTGAMCFYDMYESEIYENEIEENRYGMYVGYSYRCVFTKNYFISNEIGLFLRSTYENIIHENYFGKNKGYAIELHRFSRNNTIYRNSFVDNNIGGTSQCYDDTINYDNRWYNEETLQGNYWNDRVKGVPYQIDGDGEAEDLYPLDKRPIKASTSSIFLSLLILPIIFIYYFVKRRKRLAS